MLRISRNQFEQLAEKTRLNFVQMMNTYLHRHFAQWVRNTPDSDYETWVRVALKKCEYYAITTEPEAAQLILLFLVLGIDADEAMPWVREVLADRDLLPIGKLRKLIRLARERRIDQIDAVIVYDNMDI